MRRSAAGALILLGIAVGAARPHTARGGVCEPGRCAGDCDASGDVMIGEIVTAVNIALDQSDVERCLAADVDCDGSVSIGELIQAVNAALEGCPVIDSSPTPTPTVGGSPQPTATATPTGTPSPTTPPDTPGITYEEDFEGGWGDWYTDNGVWEVGTPTPGPAAHGGQVVAGTELEGLYPVNTDSRLISPGIRLPGVTGDERIELRFWQWYSYSGGDGAEVHVSRWDGSAWGAWDTVATPALASRWSEWSRVSVDLTAYAGQRIRLGFYHYAGDCCYGGDEADGWFIDDVELRTGVPSFSNPETFEAGWGDWYTDNGLWQIGVPTTGPGGAHDGESAAGTHLDTSYATWTSSRLISPAFTVPQVSGEERVELRFWQWYSYSGGDNAEVHVSRWNGEGWDEWQSLGTTAYPSTFSDWSPTNLDLTAYAGESIRLGFYHYASDCCYGVDEADGWFIDDVEIRKRPL